ncbi:mannosyltransferase [Orbilia brochopaga]|uniref:Mannosyltransferase n=1 Tax=Orbilia brochopaga TaxID=3140254 RepID=A0AAV9URT7_9PEZI
MEPVFVAPNWLSHPLVLYPTILIALATILVRVQSWRFGTTSKAQRRIVQADPIGIDSKASSRPSAKRLPGQWIPVDFKAPDPPPYPDWDVKSTKPLPYRPFKYGPNYFVTMGLRKGNFDEWIELDNEFLKFHAIKKERIEVRGDKCCKTAPEAMDAAIELLELLRDYLPKRYPSMFVATPVGMNNIVTGEQFNIVQRPLAEEPMRTIGRLLQDDIAIMMEGSDGQYYLKSGSILLPGFWKLEEKFNMNLSDIHTSGNVPQFREKLEKGMTNFFKRVMPDDIVLRNNYFMQVDDNLAWSDSIGPEDSDHTGWFTAQKNKVIENHWFRSERQSLRRLPRSGGVVFTIRTYFHPVTEIVKEPYIPGRLASALRSWGDDVANYKGRERYQAVLLEYLDREYQKQLDSGMITEDSQSPLKYPY